MEEARYCLAHFDFGEMENRIPQFVKTAAIKQYSKLRAEAVDLINPMLDIWNNGYTKEVNGDDDAEYNHYISDKFREILYEVNDNVITAYPFVKLDCDDRNADIVGRFRCFGKKVTMHMIVTPDFLTAEEVVERFG